MKNINKYCNFNFWTNVNIWKNIWGRAGDWVLHHLLDLFLVPFVSQPHSNYIDDLFIETSGIDLGLINKPNCLRIAQAQLEKKNLFIFVYLINRANYNLPTCGLVKI